VNSPRKKSGAAPAVAKQAVLKIDRQRRIVISTFFGAVTDELLLRHGKTIAEHEDFDPSFADIVDFTGAQTGAIAEATLQSIAQAKSLFKPDVPHVIIAPSNEMAVVARKYQQITAASRPKLFVVRTLKEGYQLLALQGYC
jgi:hypothetical protein